MMRVLFVLQNPWRRGTRCRIWDGPSWERALWRSMTGKRLREFIPKGVGYKVINGNPIAANNGRVVLPLDEDYVLGHVASYRPALVVLLGKEAGGLDALPEKRVLRLRHPCYRQLSKEDTQGYQRLILETLVHNALEDVKA